MTLTEFIKDGSRRAHHEPDMVFLFVPGILQWPNQSRNWSSLASLWFMLHDYRAASMSYFCGPLGRRLHQQRRINHCKAMLADCIRAEKDISIVCHSNGDAICTSALEQMDWPKINTLHLVSGAGPADFEQCGFNDALARGRIGRIVVYVAGKDRALRLASTFLGRWLGYGTLGLHGPQNMVPVAAMRVRQVSEPDFGHSTWFDPQHFESTMRRLLQ